MNGKCGVCGNTLTEHWCDVCGSLEVVGGMQQMPKLYLLALDILQADNWDAIRHIRDELRKMLRRDA